MSTLVRNVTGRPLAVTTVGRAVVLVLEGDAVVVEAAGRLRSQHLDVPRPLVIQLLRYVHVPPQPVALTRTALLARDGGRCVYCGENATTVDHVVPRSRGGAHRWDNVVAACRPCNGRKADRLLAELGWTLASSPDAPVRG